MARVYRSIITGLSLLLGLCVVCSVLLLEPKPFLHRWLPSISHGRGGCPLASSEKAFRSNSHLLGRLFSGPGLIQLTEGRESYDEVLNQLPQYRALVVVTAGRGTPTRRAESQPYISLAATPTSPSASPLAALALPLRLMNTGAAAVEAALGRRLYPITLDTFTRTAGAAGPYAVYDVSAGRLLLDAGMAAAVWGGGSSSVISGASGTSGSSGSSSTQPQTAFLTEQLASRVFGQLAAEVAPRAKAATAGATAGASATAATGGATAGGADGSRQPRRRLSQAAAGVGVDVVGDGDGGFLMSERNGDEDVAEEREAAAYAGVAEPELGAAAGQAQAQGQGGAHAQLLGEGEEEGEEEGGAQPRAFEELDDGDVAAQAAAAAATAMQQRQYVAHKVDTYVGQKQRRPDATADPAATAGGAGATAGENAASAADDAVETAEAEAEAGDANSVDDRFRGRQSARLGATDAVVEDAEEEQQQQQHWGGAEGGGSGAGAGASAAAAAAAAAVAAAVAAALPAAFSAAPPLWFCVLCPSVLGLVAPLAINMILNQVAGALCTQLHLTDDQCFDVLLGALAAGFVLSLASAIPIFFVCRLPECANRNVTAALRALRGAAPL